MYKFLLKIASFIGASQDESVEKAVGAAYEKFSDIIGIVMPVILGAVLLAGVVYSVILGVKYSKAEETEDRNKAKQQLIGCIVGFVITLVLILVIYAVLNARFIKDLFPKVDSSAIAS